MWLARAAWLLIFIGVIAVFVSLAQLNIWTVYRDWQIEEFASLLGINIFSRTYNQLALMVLGLRYVGILLFVAVALLILWRKSNDWMALYVSAMLLLIPVSFSFGGMAQTLETYSFPWDEILVWTDRLLQLLGIVLLLNLFFIFPDGHFVPRATRWMALGITVVFSVVMLTGALGIETEEAWVWISFLLISGIAMLSGAAAQVYRYRRVSEAQERAQTRWVVFGLVGAVACALFIFVAGGLGLSGLAILLLPAGLIAPVLILITFALAMTRDGLWKSDPLLNRALVYGSLTAILLAVYVAIIAGLSEVFRGTNNFIVAAIATGIVALLFQPLRERIQLGINRLMYGERDDPFRMLNRLGEQLEHSLAPDAAMAAIVETIVKNLRVPYAEIALTADSGPQTTSVHYPPSAMHNSTAGLTSFPLRYQDNAVGELKIARRAPNENFAPADVQLLENLARHAGAVAYTARLNAQLQQSRERIIIEREQERRRLRRDLHDGLGPTLASQTLKLDAAIELLNGQDANTTSARKILGDVKAQTQNTVADIRRIVYELRPPALDDLGLVGALQAHLGQYHSMNGLQIRLDAPDELPPLSAAVQVNAYRIVLEAVNNVVKHAGARMCVVEVKVETGDRRLETVGESNVMRQTSSEDEMARKRVLIIMVVDDGVGMPEKAQVGVGITSMRERAEELGGTFKIELNEPKGTRVIAALPISKL